MTMIEEGEEQLQKEDRAIRVKETRKNYLIGVSLLVGTGLTISASISNDIPTFLLSFGIMISAYVLALVAAVIYNQRRGRLVT
jgi:hypothetical protein